MSFIARLGQDKQKDEKLVLLKKKYYRNILEFNQVWQQEKKETQIRQKQLENNQLNQIVKQELEALDKEREKRWIQKVNTQDLLKYDYDHQITQRTAKLHQEKARDQQYLRLQEAHDDKLTERRILDLMKIYDRKAVKYSSHRRIRTEGLLPTHNPENDEAFPKCQLQLTSIQPNRPTVSAFNHLNNQQKVSIVSARQNDNGEGSRRRQFQSTYKDQLGSIETKGETTSLPRIQSRPQRTSSYKTLKQI